MASARWKCDFCGHPNALRTLRTEAGREVCRKCILQRRDTHGKTISAIVAKHKLTAYQLALGLLRDEALHAGTGYDSNLGIMLARKVLEV